VSIGIPVYNGEKILSLVIESLLKQTYQNIELIISDNCSTDSTEIICRQFVQQDARVKYFKQHSNIGMFPNFNFVFQKSIGSYFMWAAADDKWDCSFIEKAVEVLESNQACTSVFSHFEIFDINTSICIEVVTPSSNSSELANIRLRRVIEELHPNLIYGLHRKDLLKDNYFETIDWSDLLFIARLASKGKFFIIPQTLYYLGINGSKRIPYSATGKLLNLFPFIIKFSKLLYSNSNGILSFIKNIVFALRIVLISTIKVNRDILKSK